jgi:hypothetical protein
MRTGGRRPAALGLLLLCGCSLHQPPPREDLLAPYAQRQLWAVVPPANESGVSLVDTDRLADMFVQELQQTAGIDTLPVNRVLAGLRQLERRAAGSSGDIQALLDLLGADGLIVGSLTAYDPYPPMTLGMAVQLFVREGGPERESIDPVQISRTTRGEIALGGMHAAEPVAQAAGVFALRDQQTLAHLQAYAASRHEPESGYGPDVYLVSMELFARFVSHRLIRDLLAAEHARLTRMASHSPGR